MSAPGKTATAVYLAGRIAKNDWRHDICNLRGVMDDQYGTWEAAREPHRVPVKPEFLTGGGPTHVCGPYFISCDHGGFHGEGTHGVGLGAGGDESCCEPPEIELGLRAHDYALTRCMTSLHDADVVFVWAGPDFEQAHGTHTEIGAAYALGKPIYVVATDASLRKVRRETWFPMEMANRVIRAANPQHGFALFSVAYAASKGAYRS